MIVKALNLYRCNIVGIPGNYAVKAQGNNRIMARDFVTIEEAEQWIKENLPMWGFKDISDNITPEQWNAFLNELKQCGVVVKCTK